MNEQEFKDLIILEFVNIQRLKKAEDKDAEIEYQLKIWKSDNYIIRCRNHSAPYILLIRP